MVLGSHIINYSSSAADKGLILNTTVTIGYDVPSQSRVILTLFNVLGQPVRTLIDDTQQAGSYRVTWDGTDQFGASVSMGVYFYRLQAGDYSVTKKMLLLK